MISVRHKGGYAKLTKYLVKLDKTMKFADLDKYGREGVAALASKTPIDTGKTSQSWYYEIERGDGYAKIIYCNSNVQNGFPVAIHLQYGHGTGTGGWVEGIDYINPAIRPVFEKIAKNAWREVTNV